jgi:hypothetical protein
MARITPELIAPRDKMPPIDGNADMIERLRRAERIGRPLGQRVLTVIERTTRRVLAPAKRVQNLARIQELSALSP